VGLRNLLDAALHQHRFLHRWHYAEITKRTQGQQDNLDATMNRINNGDDGDKEMDENLAEYLRTSAMLLLEQILMDKSTDPVGAIEGLLNGIP
jgi:hypothetical protein